MHDGCSAAAEGHRRAQRAAAGVGPGVRREQRGGGALLPRDGVVVDDAHDLGLTWAVYLDKEVRLEGKGGRLYRLPTYPNLAKLSKNSAKTQS